MPALTAILGSVLLWAASRMLVRVLIGLGVSVIAYQGLDTLLDSLETYIIANFNALPAEVVAFASIMKIGVCMNIFLSAASMRLVLQGLTEGSIIKMFVGVKGIGN